MNFQRNHRFCDLCWTQKRDEVAFSVSWLDST